MTGRDLVERARTIHTLLPVATAALGRTLLAASMMGDMLKEDNGALTLQHRGRRAPGHHSGCLRLRRERAGLCAGSPCRADGEGPR
ncbi:MAG: Hsp33 family molecular chaperone HslO [Lawsonibacter sp.]